MSADTFLSSTFPLKSKLTVVLVFFFDIAFYEINYPSFNRSTILRLHLVLRNGALTWSIREFSVSNKVCLDILKRFQPAQCINERDEDLKIGGFKSNLAT